MRPHVETFEASVERRDDGKLVLRARHVGWWREAPSVGASLRPGDRLGRVEVLGVLHPLVVPAGAAGFVVELGGDPRLARRPIECGQVVAVLDPEAMPAAAAIDDVVDASTGGLVFASPSSGRFYRRPTPDAEPFVREGEVIERGRVVAIVEIMKTFHRVAYDGPSLPDRAKVLRVVPDDGADLEAGQPLLAIEPA